MIITERVSLSKILTFCLDLKSRFEFRKMLFYRQKYL